MSFYDHGMARGEERKHSNSHAVAGDEAAPTAKIQFVDNASLQIYNRVEVLIRKPAWVQTSYRVDFYRWMPGSTTPNIILAQTSGVLTGTLDRIVFDHQHLPWTVRIHTIVTGVPTDGTPFDVRYSGLNVRV